MHALQILDDTLAVSDDVPALRTHFGRCSAHLGTSMGFWMRRKNWRYVETPAVVFCGKAVSVRGISHPPFMWAGACLQLLAMADRCSSKKGLQILLGNLNWLAGHGHLARPFLAPLYHLLHHSRCKRVPAGYVRRCMHAALALAAIPRHVTWGLSLGLGLPDLSSGLIVYVDADAAHDFGLACVVLVKIGSTESTTLQLRIPEPYCKSQQRAERWGLLQALGLGWLSGAGCTPPQYVRIIWGPSLRIFAARRPAPISGWCAWRSGSCGCWSGTFRPALCPTLREN